MISRDFLTRWNAITVRKGRVSYLKKETPSFPTFQVKARLYVNFIAVRKYNFLDSLLFCFVYKIFAVTIQNIIP